MISSAILVRNYKAGAIWLLICGSLVLSVFWGAFASAQELLTINTADKPPYSTEFDTGIYDKIILQLFGNLKINVKINHLGSARSIENVNVGIDDAEYARIKGLSDHYKNIRIIDEKLIDFAFTAFVKDSSVKIDGWESFADYNVAFIRGWKIYENNVEKAKSVLLVSSEEELFQVLVHGRVDVILYERLRGLDFMKRKQITGIVPLAEPLSVRGMYLYINKKHEKIIPDIEDSLKLMKESGQYNSIIDSYIL